MKRVNSNSGFGFGGHPDHDADVGILRGIFIFARFTDNDCT